MSSPICMHTYHILNNADCPKHTSDQNKPPFVEKKGVENLENLQNKDANREVKKSAGVCSVKSSSSSKSSGVRMTALQWELFSSNR